MKWRLLSNVSIIVFANVLNEMRLGIMSEESIKIFRGLDRPIHYEDNINGTEL